MDPLAYLLDGLEKWLETERELGARSLEVDRTLLSAPPPAAPPPKRPAAAAPAAPGKAEIAFLHDRPLSPAGEEMMAKIVAALGLSPESAPVVLETPPPDAEMYVVLGSLALRKFFPGKAAGPGDWISTPDGRDALVTYSPAYILRFAKVTPAVKEIKMKMWQSLKTAAARLARRRGGAPQREGVAG